MPNPLPVIAADFKQAKAGILAVVALIALAVGLGVGVSAQERAFREGSTRAADAFDLLIGARGSETQLVLSSIYLQTSPLDLIDGNILQDLIENPRVKFASPIGFGDNYRGYPIVGVTPQFVTDNTGTLVEGRVFRAINQVVVGHDVQLRVGDTFEPSHGRMTQAGAQEEHGHLAYKVVGRLSRLGNPWDRAILAPIEAVWWVHGLPTGHPEYADIFDLGEGHAEGAGGPKLEALPLGPPFTRSLLPGVPSIVVEPRTFAAAYQLRQQYRSDDRTMALFPAEVLLQIYSLVGDVRDLLAVISVITQVLVVGAILLAVLAALALRRKTIAVLRAMGASQGYIFLTVWLNVTLMIAAGAALGLLVGWGTAKLLSAVFAQSTGLLLPVRLSLQEYALVATIIAIGLVLAAIPSLLTYRQSVSAALRQ
ncbi:MAG: ABC transporter permease [Alphaproteobacteria bacterium]|nr:ABC transporter permease [Alphaproteobacteria bacterium]